MKESLPPAALPSSGRVSLPWVIARLCALALTLPGFATASQTVADVRSLAPGASGERELSGDETHLYRFPLEAGQCVKVIVDQRGVDTLLVLLGPDGKQLIEDDNLLDNQGTDVLLWRAQAPGDYRLKVSAREKGGGRYGLRTEFFSGDERRALAIQNFNQGVEIVRGQKRESFDRAAGVFEAALAQWREAGDREMELRTLVDLGLLSRLMDNRGKGLEYYQQALAGYQALGMRPEEALVLNNAAICYTGLGEPAKALEYYQRVATLSDTLSPRGLAIVRSNTGNSYSNLGEYRRALEEYQGAWSVFREQNAEVDEMIVLGNLANTYQAMGEPIKALEHNQRALDLSRKLKRPAEEAAFVYGRGQVWLSAGDYQKAAEEFEQALDVARRAGSRSGQAFALAGLGAAAQSLGDDEVALGHLTQALELNRAIGRKDGEAAMLSRIGAIRSGRGEFHPALEYQQQALAHYHGAGNRWFEIDTMVNLARTYQRMGERPKAQELLDQALALSRATEGRPKEAQILRDLSGLAREAGDLGRARQLMEAALGEVEATRGRFGVQELKTAFGATAQRFYEDETDLLMEMHAQNPQGVHNALALEMSERGRARALLDLLVEARAEVRQGADAALLAQERDLQQRLGEKDNAWRRLLVNQRAAKQAAALAKEIDELSTQLRLLEARLRSSSPRYAALTQPQPLSVAQIRQLLDDQTVLLEFALGEKRSWVWAVTQSSLDSFQLPPRAEIESAARKVYGLLTARQPKEGPTAAQHQALVADADARFQAEAGALSRLLLGQLAARLRGEWADKRLLIVAAGALEYLPFAALPVPPADGAAAGGSPSLLAGREVINLPSASVLREIRREVAGRQAAPGVVAVIADPVFEANDPRVTAALRGSRNYLASRVRSAGGEQPSPAAESGLTRAAQGFTSRDFSRLPFSREEAEAIAALVPRASLLKATDFGASRATATGPDLARYRLVHFATHGLLNSQHPELSGLVLSLVDSQGQPQDGFLRLHQIYNLKLAAEVVVLSACQTALGKQIRGEGLVGLTRGFMYAGAPRVVASLWQVDDLATAELMRRFYRGMLKQGLRPAAALRAAQLELGGEKRWAAPYYWAGFVLLGEWR